MRTTTTHAATQARPRPYPRRLPDGIVGLMAAALLHLSVVPAHGQGAGLEITTASQPFVEEGVPYNHSSERGFPLSTVVGNPVGSDGRAPTVVEQTDAGLTTNPATPAQFRGFTSYDLAVGPNLGDSVLESVDASNTIFMTTVEIGAPMVAQQVSFLFGSTIPAPSTDENDDILSVDPSEYWLAEPHVPSGVNTKYYFSPHALQVFATESGVVDVVWVTQASTTTVPPEFATNPENYLLEGGNYRTLYTKTYLVSGSPVQPPQKIYWNVGGHTGPSVTVPPSRVGDIHIVYNDAVPESVSVEEAEANLRDRSPVVHTDTLSFVRNASLNELKAFNREGRVFLELLGDTDSGNQNRKEHLGFEIVDILKEAVPADIDIKLGERMTAYQNGRDDSILNPEPVDQSNRFSFTHVGSGAKTLYAVQETLNQNDLLVHWMIIGQQGIEWPFRYTRYDLKWPAEESNYSHYIRPEVATSADSAKTGVALPDSYSTEIAYQDPVAAPLGAHVTADLRFYTHLTPELPKHRTLLQYSLDSSVGFERVYSRLVSSTEVVPSEFDETPPAEGFVEFDDANSANKGDTAKDEVRFVHRTVNVGDRIEAPIGEAGASALEDYLAGYIKTSKGTSYNAGAYIDPFVDGFESANQGAIIPVNAIPGSNQLEVWWFRPRNLGAAKGFKTIHWPSVIGRYTIQWPAEPREIIFANDDGSGPLESLETDGTIYVQNDSSLHGFNPNEEHALVAGGQAFALRDDLNDTTDLTYSSAPYVLLDHLGSDGRPDMAIFKVLREKLVDDILFRYTREVPLVLQAPMPLPLMDTIELGAGVTDLNNVSEELVFQPKAEDLGAITASAWLPSFDVAMSLDIDTDETALEENIWYFLVNPNDPIQRYWYYFDYVENGTMIGYFSKHRPYPLEVSEQTDTTVRVAGQRPFDYRSNETQTVLIVDSQADVRELPFTVESYDLSSGSLGLSSNGVPGGFTTAHGWPSLSLLDSSPVDGDFNGWLLYEADTPILEATLASSNPFVHEDRKGTLWMYRGPHHDADRSGFGMRYYYKTRPGFYFPSLASASQPAVGTFTPYLRAKDSDGIFLGSITGNLGQALSLVYKPVWPSNPAVMQRGYTLTKPALGLPAARGQTSLQVLYQQSTNQGIADNGSVILHDPTREKQYFLGVPNGFALDDIPASVRSEPFRGLTYFPNLPPHLSDRFFLDPNRGAYGALVLRGEFFDEALGADYLLLNALTPTEVDIVKDLASASDLDRAEWDAAIDGLATTLETFREDFIVPGTFIVNSTEDVGVTALPEINDADTAVDSYALSNTGPGVGFVTMIAGNGDAFTPTDEPVSMNVFLVTDDLFTGEIKIVQSSNPLAEKLTLQQVVDLAGKADDFVFDWRIEQPVDGAPPTISEDLWAPIDNADGTRVTIGGQPSITSLVDNYLVVRYGPKDPSNPGQVTSWSDWTSPQLAEGWIKRVLGGINPFNQRVTDLFNNTVNTSASILEQAGGRWEGDVALNLDNINEFGLIEIYETILRRGRGLSIDAGINYGPANDALLLAAGYLNDLYMMVGNEALADAANPTIGIAGTDVATALFSFKGQLATLLDEELALLRGRDDFLQPGVEVSPVYNRLIWNYTRGIDSGEVIYANNYNIQENQEEDLDGVINAEDAQVMFPQGHGDAYGHYLTALKGYYHLLIDADFTWIPRTEAVTVLGKPVQVDYLDERKFAVAASALARAGNQVFDLTWRKDFKSGGDIGWEHLSATRTNGSTGATRNWGADHWASRAGQGAFVNWVVGNAMLPAVDPDPDHEGIEKIDRTTVPELDELPAVLRDLQASMDNAEARMSPLGLSESSIPFDISPGGGTPFATGADTHFEQIYNRSIGALNNAVTAFDDAKDVTRKMRSDQNSLTSLQTALDKEELAYKNALVELYGTPYPDDIGPGRTFVTGYDGPDFDHYMYVDLVGLTNPVSADTFKIDIQGHADDWQDSGNPNTSFDFIVKRHRDPLNREYVEGQHFLSYSLDSHGFFQKPSEWQSRRESPGTIQRSISAVISARNNALSALKIAQAEKYILDRMIDVFEAYIDTQSKKRDIERGHLAAASALEFAKFVNEMFEQGVALKTSAVDNANKVLQQALPDVLIFGLANGGDTLTGAKAAVQGALAAQKATFDALTFAKKFAFGAYEISLNEGKRIQTFDVIDANDLTQAEREKVFSLDDQLGTVQGKLRAINGALQLLDDAHRSYRSALAKGIRIQEEREISRKRAAAVVQGFRTRDAALRIFRNEKLERYKTLFDLAARYSFMAAQAFDYETGLLDTKEGRRFIERIVQSRALGVVAGGKPQFAGSDAGDPGLSSALAEMKADWTVLKGRLGLNNPDVYGTTFSLRTENFRIHPGTSGDTGWREILEENRMADLMQDRDVRRYCMQISRGEGLAVPGIVVEFDTTIENGLNFFGEVLAAGDHIYSPASFANKIGTVGVALEGYIGMSAPDASASTTNGASPPTPTWSFLDPLALSATPYVYFVPVGLDVMRSPALGDASVVRNWNVQDVNIPLPFNIGASDLSTQPFYQSGDSLTEELFGIRKHQPFRPVDDASVYEGSNGRIFPSTYTNTRLVGRSVWNTRWKLIIPGHTLLADPEEGLDRLIETVKDIKLHIESYSYSGN
jgi:hypothetical protein